jgi:hypothetical protein
LRIDLSIVGGFDVFQWVSSGDANFSTTVFSPLLQEDEAPAEVEGEEAEAPAVFNYINGFNNVFIRSTFIDLNDEVMNGLANATLQVSVMSISEGGEVAKPIKGQPPVDVKPAEEALLLLCSRPPTARSAFSSPPPICSQASLSTLALRCTPAWWAAACWR